MIVPWLLQPERWMQVIVQLFIVYLIAHDFLGIWLEFEKSRVINSILSFVFIFLILVTTELCVIA